MTSQFDKYLRDFVECSAGREASGGSGDDYHELDTWQNLCAELGVKAIPPSIAQCKKVWRFFSSKAPLTLVRPPPKYQPRIVIKYAKGKFFTWGLNRP